jgi:ankyrin repeat protein
MGANLEARDRAERTPLMNAARCGNLELVNMLLDAGADKDAKTPLGDTAVSFAQKSGNTEVVSRFIQLGHSIRPQSARF